jgi:2-polyprenyl-6-methoxyphenol hydroxylase-like FAD-dependent oxidoreductase
MPPIQRLPVLILGAGVSGLTLAQGLLRASVPFRLFERDPKLNIRSQGYRFRINGPGVIALQEVLTPSLYAELERTCAYLAPEPIIHLDALTGEGTEGPRGAPVMDGEVMPMNVDRTVMREVLSQGLDGQIEFERDFERYEITAEGVEVSFSDGTRVTGCLLVGADGAWSRVKRQLVPDDYLLDTQGRFLFGKTALTAEVVELFDKEASTGMTMVRDQSQSNPLTLLLEPMHFTRSEMVTLPDDYVYWVLIAHIDRFGMDDSSLLQLSSENAASLAERLTAHWDASFKPLFAHQNREQTAVLRIASSSPNLPQWDGEGRITLIGDAAHAMSPTAGAGATTAVQDAAKLAQMLEKDGLSSESLAAYELSMRAYAEVAIQRSLFGGKLMFGMQAFEKLKPAMFARG